MYKKQACVLIFSLLVSFAFIPLSPTRAASISKSETSFNSATIATSEAEISTIPELTTAPGNLTPKPILPTPPILLPSPPVPATVFGYTSPLSTVSMTATRDLASTTADTTGYFIFRSVLVPRDTDELCFYSLDQLKRVSQQTCIPFFESYAQFDIGPILLSPTLSLSKNELEVSKNVVIAGSTLPKSKVKLYFSQNSKKPTRVDITSDSLGNFSASFTSTSPTDVRVHANSYRGLSSSPKSSSLIIRFLPYWLIILNILLKALHGLYTDILFILFLAEIAGILLLLYYMFWKKNPPRALAILEDSIILVKSSLARRTVGLSRRSGFLQK